MAEYVNIGDDYWDEQNSGLDENGKRIPNQERHEFMIGYLDDSPEIAKSRSGDLETMILASMSCSIASMAASVSI